MTRGLMTVLVAGCVALALAGCGKSDKQTREGDGEGKPAAPAKVGERTGGGGAENQPQQTPSADGGKAADNFPKVKVGMTVDDVTKLLGAPKTTVSSGAGDSAVLHHAWQDGDRQFYVQFHGGKAAIMGYGGGQPGAGTPKKDIKKNFGKIKPGMTVAQVTEILGPPATSGGSAEGQGSEWEEGDTTFTVIFINGKVQSTHVSE